MLFSAVFKKTIGPGPAHAIDPTITNKGKDGTPHYSLSPRHKELVPFNTPGPGTYGPEKKPTCFQGEKQSPAYSIGGRSKYRRRKHKIYVLEINCIIIIIMSSDTFPCII